MLPCTQQALHFRRISIGCFRCGLLQLVKCSTICSKGWTQRLTLFSTSAGWVEKHNEQECVVCPYHGWAFDSKGVCQHVPAAENMADRPKQSITEAYSVVEKVGSFMTLRSGPSSVLQVSASIGLLQGNG